MYSPLALEYSQFGNRRELEICPIRGIPGGSTDHFSSPFTVQCKGSHEWARINAKKQKIGQSLLESLIFSTAYTLLCLPLLLDWLPGPPAERRL